MERLTGDLIELAEDNHFDVIVHGCNCMHTWGAGFAEQLKMIYPEAYIADLMTRKADINKLGTYTFTTANNRHAPFFVVNAYTQFRYGRDKDKNPPVDYEAIERVFKAIAWHWKDARIAYPSIGAGLAGGDWGIIEPIIDEALRSHEHYLVIKPK